MPRSRSTHSSSAPRRATPVTPARSTAALPLGALLLASGLQAAAQTATPAADAVAGSLDTVTVRDAVDPTEIRAKSTLRATDTRLGKGQQALRDIPQHVTVMTEQLLD
ncbi:MAG: TonB-dependent siderophore receptor, partial [Tepidimonas sp.]